MQASRSLFQTGIKIGNQTAATGIRNSRPFLNTWAASGSPRTPTKKTMSSATSFYDFKPFDSAFRSQDRALPKAELTISPEKGQPFPISNLKGKVVLVVNTASQCGFTPQYEGLEKLYKDVTAKHPDSFVILGFPCNQFNNQDPGSNDEIQEFCRLNYGVTFPILGKTDVNGDHAEPLFEWLKQEKPGLMGLKRIKWNFEKFLVGRDGAVKARWASTAKPESLEGPIVEEIMKGEKATL